MSIETSPLFTRSGKATIGVALTHYANARPDAEPTCRSALKMLYPATNDMTPDACRAFFNQVPLRDLHRKLVEADKRWTPSTEAELIDRGFTTASHLKNYPARIADFVAFARSIGLAERAHVELMKEWADFLDKAFTLLPATRTDLRNLAEAGVTKLLDVYSIPVDDIERFGNKLSNVRWANRRLAERASLAGFAPRDFADVVLIGPRQGEIPNFTGQQIYTSYCRNLWNATVLAFPELRLTTWPSRQVRVSLPAEKWPMSLREGIDDALLGPARARGLRPTTLKTRRLTMGSYLGILDDLGVNLAVVADLHPKDAVRLLTQGMPRTCLRGEPASDAPRSLVTRLLGEGDFRDRVLCAMRDLEGSRDGKESAPNPYVAIFLEARLATGALAAANNLVDAVGVINREHLCIRDPHDRWLKVALKGLDRARKDVTTDYDSKKEVVFRHPRLWLDLVNAVQDMARELTDSLRRGTPRWATQCRDVAFLWLMLTYPLRVSNARRMQIGRNLDVAMLRIRFSPDEVKNEAPIDFELPTKGEYGEPLRAFFRLYLDEARPLLLLEADSPYVFLPDQRTPNAGPELRRTAFNDILISLSENKLQGVLPPELGPLNPHLLRHIVATYQIVVNNAPIKAAQLLNDRLDTVLKHYANILPGARGELRDYFDRVTLKTPPHLL